MAPLGLAEGATAVSAWIPASWGLTASTFVVSFVSGFVPVVSLELYLVSVAAIAGSGHFLPIVASATIGQVLAKLIFYLAARGVIRLPVKESTAKLESWRVRFESHPLGEDAALFLSAFLGFPPYYLVCILAGTLHLSLVRFLATGLVGRGLRFALVYAFPEVVKRWFGWGG
jgi:membrane protein YqaA with SNARE-associated domain